MGRICGRQGVGVGVRVRLLDVQQPGRALRSHPALPQRPPPPPPPTPAPGHPSLAPATTHQTRSGHRPASSGTPAEPSALPRSPSWVPSQVWGGCPHASPGQSARAPEVRRHPSWWGPGREAWRQKTGRQKDGTGRPATELEGQGRWASVHLHNSSPRKKLAAKGPLCCRSPGRGQNPEPGTAAMGEAGVLSEALVSVCFSPFLLEQPCREPAGSWGGG